MFPVMIRYCSVPNKSVCRYFFCSKQWPIKILHILCKCRNNIDKQLDTSVNLATSFVLSENILVFGICYWQRLF